MLREEKMEEGSQEVWWYGDGAANFDLLDRWQVGR